MNMNWIDAIRRRLLRWSAGRKGYKTEWCEDLPERVSNNRIYIVGGREFAYQTVMRCPCGCRGLIYVTVAEDSKSSWSLIAHADRTVSIYPSIWRTVACRSHFSLRHGRVIWSH